MFVAECAEMWAEMDLRSNDEFGKLERTVSSSWRTVFCVMKLDAANGKQQDRKGEETERNRKKAGQQDSVVTALEASVACDEIGCREPKTA